QIRTRERFGASRLAQGEKNKVRGLRAEEYDFEMFNATCRNRTVTLPLSLMKGEATQARPVHFMYLDQLFHWKSQAGCPCIDRNAQQIVCDLWPLSLLKGRGLR